MNHLTDSSVASSLAGECQGWESPRGSAPTLLNLPRVPGGHSDSAVAWPLPAAFDLCDLEKPVFPTSHCMSEGVRQYTWCRVAAPPPHPPPRMVCPTTPPPKPGLSSQQTVTRHPRNSPPSQAFRLSTEGGGTTGTTRQGTTGVGFGAQGRSEFSGTVSHPQVQTLSNRTLNQQ